MKTSTMGWMSGEVRTRKFTVDRPPSYSAVLFDDDDLAMEVNELEDQSDALVTDIETWVIEASEQVRDTNQLRGLFRLQRLQR